jgi:nitroimidazol reductase NimA-like FMN-containing flavoprotein (pyridoxamine 5'-phosphate oxidase superfamily)
MKDKDIVVLIGDLFAAQRLAVLATDRSGKAYATLVGFVAAEDLKTLFFATTRSTRKYKALTANPEVAMLIDSRSNRAQDFRDAVAVTATGVAGEIDKGENPSVLEAYVAKHPHLEDFVASPTCAFIQVRVRAYHVVTRFQHVMTLNMEP